MDPGTEIACSFQQKKYKTLIKCLKLRNSFLLFTNKDASHVKIHIWQMGGQIKNGSYPGISLGLRSGNISNLPNVISCFCWLTMRDCLSGRQRTHLLFHVYPIICETNMTIFEPTKCFIYRGGDACVRVRARRSPLQAALDQYFIATDQRDYRQLERRQRANWRFSSNLGLGRDPRLHCRTF